LLSAQKKIQIQDKLEFILIRRENKNIKNLTNINICRINEYPGNLYKSLNGVPAAIFTLLLYGVKNLKIYKTTFYTGDKIHSEGYRGKFEKSGRILSNLLPIFSNHDLITQKKFVRSIVYNKMASGNIPAIYIKEKIYLTSIVNNFKIPKESNARQRIHKPLSRIILFVETPLHFKLASSLMKELVDYFKIM
jgi:hypothetical protein